ncbi:MAG: hypothetical protein M3Z25_15995 [Actinomycetota bacterium]|nr:hypothetical protein [Actinomycetota bacterium]
MQWGDRSEVSVVEGKDSAGIQPGRQNDRRAISQSQAKVRVLAVEPHGCGEISRVETLDAEPASSEIVQERQSGRSTDPLPKQVVRLGGDLGWDDQGAGLGVQNRAHRVAHGIPAVSKSDQWSGVDQQRHDTSGARQATSGARQATSGARQAWSRAEAVEQDPLVDVRH